MWFISSTYSTPMEILVKQPTKQSRFYPFTLQTNKFVKTLLQNAFLPHLTAKTVNFCKSMGLFNCSSSTSQTTFLFQIWQAPCEQTQPPSQYVSDAPLSPQCTIIKNVFQIVIHLILVLNQFKVIFAEPSVKVGWHFENESTS